MPDGPADLITPAMRACIGTTTDAVSLPEEIGASDVRRFCDVIGETNPIYWEDAAAQQAGYRKRVVPPMLVVQFFRRVDDAEGEERAAGVAWPGLELPPEFTNARNAGHRFDWLKPVYVGDRLVLQQRLTDIFVKTGRAGLPIIFLKRETEIRNQDGEVVVRQTSTTARMPEGSVSGAKPATASA
jgi:acyl dehydratase